MLKENKGVTLVALVITIIVLLILAGVSISLVAGDNGVLSQAVNATDSTNEAAARQQLSMAISSLQADFFADVWTNNSAATFDQVCTTSALQAYMGTDDDGNAYTVSITDTWTSAGTSSATTSGSVVYKGDTYTFTLTSTSSKTGCTLSNWSKTT